MSLVAIACCKTRIALLSHCTIELSRSHSAFNIHQRHQIRFTSRPTLLLKTGLGIRTVFAEHKGYPHLEPLVDQGTPARAAWTITNNNSKSVIRILQLKYVLSLIQMRYFVLFGILASIPRCDSPATKYKCQGFVWGLGGLDLAQYAGRLLLEDLY